MRLKDTIILVTVSTHGIGLAIVKSCVREGSSVCMAALDLVQAKAIAAELSTEGCRIHCIYNDAAKPEPFVPMVDENVQQSGRIAVLVNNFSTSARRTAPALSHTAPEVFLSTETPNLHSVFIASQTAAKSMTARGKGSIINIGSVGGTGPDISQIAYGTSKAAINDLTKLIAEQKA